MYIEHFKHNIFGGGVHEFDQLLVGLVNCRDGKEEGGGYGNGQPETENPSLHTDDTPLQVIISECSPNTCLAVGYLYESVR